METGSASRGGEKSCARLERDPAGAAAARHGWTASADPLPGEGRLGKLRHGAGRSPGRGHIGEIHQPRVGRSAGPTPSPVKRLFSPRRVRRGPAPSRGCGGSRGFAERDGEPVGAGPVGLGAGGTAASLPGARGPDTTGGPHPQRRLLRFHLSERFSPPADKQAPGCKCHHRNRCYLKQTRALLTLKFTGFLHD